MALEDNPALCENLTDVLTDIRNSLQKNDTDATNQIRTEQDAVLYIVVTLLFYSIGIIVGIITYLKREKQEMEEEKQYQTYFDFKQDPYTEVKSKRVEQVAARLLILEEEKRLRDECLDRPKPPPPTPRDARKEPGLRLFNSRKLLETQLALIYNRDSEIKIPIYVEPGGDIVLTDKLNREDSLLLETQNKCDYSKYSPVESPNAPCTLLLPNDNESSSLDSFHSSKSINEQFVEAVAV